VQRVSVCHQVLQRHEEEVEPLKMTI
jgi:hypothetical protein